MRCSFFIKTTRLGTYLHFKSFANYQKADARVSFFLSERMRDDPNRFIFAMSRVLIDSWRFSPSPHVSWIKCTIDLNVHTYYICTLASFFFYISDFSFSFSFFVLWVLPISSSQIKSPLRCLKKKMCFLLEALAAITKILFDQQMG